MPRPSHLIALLEALTAAGGVGDRATLIGASSRATLERAVRDGVVVRVGIGVYAVAELGEPGTAYARSRAWSRWQDGPDEAETRALRARHARARGLRAVLSHRCAAAHHGWPVLRDPVVLELAVPHDRHPVPGADLVVRRSTPTHHEAADHVTAPLRTVLDCARDLPFAEGLAVADSALRLGAVGRDELREAAARYGGRGGRQMRRVAEHADGGAANPFESALRAAVLGVPGLDLATQVKITDHGARARVDLADRRLRVVLEADSYEFHGSEESFARDRRRYVELTVAGWLVLPFGFTDVLDRPEWVRSMTEGAVMVRRAGGSHAA